MRTTYFAHCWGVFEGGGVRGAAHAGAFAAARAAGIHFGRVAGTSAGSMVAALVAAGADPAYVSRQVRDTPFTTFIAPPDPRDSVFATPSGWLRTIRALSSGRIHELLTVACFAGLYSSRPIEAWMEAALKELVCARHPEVAHRPVRFRDLALPLHIVASDLASSRPHVWSAEATPDESVAFAVRCSCTIPLFYQAVQYGPAVLVDGGLLSNMPAFVFATLGDHERSVLSRTVSFQLQGDPLGAAESMSSLLPFLMRLSDTAIRGATSIQLSLQPDVYSVAISTGKVDSTDFSAATPEMAMILHRSGEMAVADFIASERAVVRRKPSRRVSRGLDEKLLLLVQGLDSCQHEMLIAGPDTYWTNFVFPSLLAAARRRIRLVVYVTTSDDTKEVVRRNLLRRLGAVVMEVDEVPFDGFVFDAGSSDSTAAIGGRTESTGDNFEEEEISTYNAWHDRPVIDSLTRMLPATNATPQSPGTLPFTAVPPDTLFGRLRRVSQYRNASFELRTVRVSPALQVLQKSVKEFKVVQINLLVKALRESGVSLFHPQQVVFADGTASIVTPPVVERVGDRLVLIEGNTRAFHCLREGIDEMTAVVVTNVEAPLPASYFSISDVKLTSTTTPLASNLVNYDKAEFRRIEECVHE